MDKYFSDDPVEIDQEVNRGYVNAKKKLIQTNFIRLWCINLNLQSNRILAIENKIHNASKNLNYHNNVSFGCCFAES